MVQLALPPEARGDENLSLGLDRLNLASFEDAPETSSESTIVEIPVPITLRAAKDGRIGIRLRLSVFFAWNNVRIEEIDGEVVVEEPEAGEGLQLSGNRQLARAGWSVEEQQPHDLCGSLLPLPPEA